MTKSTGENTTGNTAPLSGNTSSSRHTLEAVGFVTLATALCFGIAAPAIFGSFSDELVGLLVPLAQLTPFIAALACFMVVRPGAFAKQFALSWGTSGRAIGVGIIAVVVISSLQLIAGLAIGFSPVDSDAILLAACAVPLIWIMQSVFAIGEELGWRGWLVSRLKALPFVTLAAISALAWMIWHLPAIALIVGDASAEVGIAYLLAIGSWAPFMVALRLWSGSVWPAVIVHGALNSVRVFFTQSIATGEGVNWLVEATGWILWLGAAWLLRSRVAKRASNS